MNKLTSLTDPSILRNIADNVPDMSSWSKPIHSTEQIDDLLALVIEEISSLENIVVHAEMRSYGSGYASYFHVHCNKPDDLVAPAEGAKTIQGLTIYFCRLFPVFVFGPEFRYLDRNGIATSFLEIDRIEELPPGEWTKAFSEILLITDRHGLEVLPKSMRETLVPSDIVWESNFNTKTVFDLLFHWLD